MLQCTETNIYICITCVLQVLSRLEEIEKEAKRAQADAQPITGEFLDGQSRTKGLLSQHALGQRRHKFSSRQCKRNVITACFIIRLMSSQHASL